MVEEGAAGSCAERFRTKNEKRKTKGMGDLTRLSRSNLLRANGAEFGNRKCLMVGRIMNNDKNIQ